MADGNQFQLLRERRCLPFFLTQALGAFNDNVFKNALVILVAFLTTQLSVADGELYTNLAAALFILPFLLFSATSGQLVGQVRQARGSRSSSSCSRSRSWLVACAGFVSRNSIVPADGDACS